MDLSQSTDQLELNEKSMLMRYFYALIGEDLNIYGSNEFNQTQDDSLLFFNTIDKKYQLAPGDTIQVTITGLSPSDETYQVMNDGTITLENVYPLNVNNLNLTLDVNGNRHQTGNTNQMIFNFNFLIAHLSSYITLMPVDIITTGTPPGVGLGMNPPKFLKNGDEMHLKVDYLGQQKTKVISE